MRGRPRRAPLTSRACPYPISKRNGAPGKEPRRKLGEEDAERVEAVLAPEDGEVRLVVGDGLVDVRRVDERDVGRVCDGEVEEGSQRQSRQPVGGDEGDAAGTPWRRAFVRARASAASERSTATTRAPGLSSAIDTARMPLPVPASRIVRAEGAAARAISTIASVSPRGMSARGSTRKVRPRNSHSPRRYCSGSPEARRVARARKRAASSASASCAGGRGTRPGASCREGEQLLGLVGRAGGSREGNALRRGARPRSARAHLAIARARGPTASEAHAVEHEVDDDARDGHVEPDGESDPCEPAVALEPLPPGEDERGDGQERDGGGEDACASGGSTGRPSGRRPFPGSGRSRPRRGKRGRRRGRGSSRRRPKSSRGGARRGGPSG